MPELYVVEAHVIDRIKETQVEFDIPGCPIGAKGRRFIMSQCPVVIDAPSEADTDFSFTESDNVPGYGYELGLRQPSSAHQRSFMITGDDFNQLWFDSYGNQFNAFSIKGNNFSNPGLMEHPTAIDQFVAWGLQESKIIERVILASNVMRAKGISTEYIVGLAEPKNYPWPASQNTHGIFENVTLQEYRRRITKQFWNSLTEEQQTSSELENLRTKMDAMTFYLSMRATDSAYRVGDIAQGKSPDALKEVYQQINNLWLLPEHAPLDVKDHKDWNRYLLDYLSPRIADNLAKLHSCDLAHGFLHPYNITSLGGIVDTDSIHGEILGLGDDPVTAFEKAKDLFQVASGLHTAFEGNLLSFKRSPIVHDFAELYVTLSTQTGHDTQTYQQVGETIAYCQVDALSESSSLTDQMVSFEIQKAYHDMLMSEIMGNDKYKALDVCVTEQINNAAIDCDAEIFGWLDTNIEEHIEAMLDEASNEIAYGEIDPVESLLLNRGGFDVSSNLISDIQGQVKQSMRQVWIDSFETQVPGYAETLSPLVVDMVFKTYIAEKSRLINIQVGQILEEYYDANKDDLEKMVQFTKAEPISDEHENYYRAGSEQGFLFVTSDGVPKLEVNQYAHVNNIKITHKFLKEDANPHWIKLHITDSSSIHNILTDGAMMSSSYDREKDTLYIEAEPMPTDEQMDLTYIAVIDKSASGEVSIIMYNLHPKSDPQ